MLDQQQVEFELLVTLGVLLLEGGRRVVVVGHHCLQAGEGRGVEPAGDARHQRRLELLAYLVDVVNGRRTKEEVVAEQLHAAVGADLGDKGAALGSGTGLDQALCLEGAHRLANGALGGAQGIDQMLLLGQSLAGRQAMLGDIVLERLGDGMGALAARSSGGR